jgi:hypothetical protein
MVKQAEQDVNDPTTREFFETALSDFEVAAESLTSAARTRYGWLTERQAKQEALKDIEARKVANGEAEGKNAEERKAALQVLMAEDGEAAGIRRDIDRLEGSIANIDIELERLRGVQASARYRMRYADATLRFLTGQQPTQPHESEE